MQVGLTLLGISNIISIDMTFSLLHVVQMADARAWARRKYFADERPGAGPNRGGPRKGRGRKPAPAHRAKRVPDGPEGPAAGARTTVTGPR